MKTIYERHLELVDAVNDAETEREHVSEQRFLDGFRHGLEMAGQWIDLCAADYHSEDRFGDRPTCCGVLLDWKPKENQ